MNIYKKISLVLVLGLGFSAAANSDVMYDNLSSPEFEDPMPITPGWIAAAFSTGANTDGYNFGNITLGLRGEKEDSIKGLVVQLFSDTGSGILGTTPIGHPFHSFKDPLESPPSINSVFTPDALDASLVLTPDTIYWVKLDATSNDAENVSWAFASSGTGAWAFDTGINQGGGTDRAFIMKVEANAVTAAIPVPAAAWFMGTGLIGLVSSWHRKKAN
jgi:hypothetical protein